MNEVERAHKKLSRNALAWFEDFQRATLSGADLAQAPSEEEFDAELARLGHTDNHTPEVRHTIEEAALGHIRDSYGEFAAEHCRRLLAPPRRRLSCRTP